MPQELKQRKNIFQNNLFRFGITFLLCLQYSLLRETSYSTFTKPLPIIFWLVIALSSKKQKEGRWLVISLTFAFLGDILLDLGEAWLKIGALPFLGSTAFLALGFHRRLQNSNQSNATFRKKALVFLLLFLPFLLLFLVLIQYSSETAFIGAVLYTLSVFLLFTSLSNLLFNLAEKVNPTKVFLGFVGACGIVANYVLYSIDLHLHPIPRDLVIQVYYWGTAFAAWSFLDKENGRKTSN